MNRNLAWRALVLREGEAVILVLGGVVSRTACVVGMGGDSGGAGGGAAGSGATGGGGGGAAKR
jgi:hypothetical protein